MSARTSSSDSPLVRRVSDLFDFPVPPTEFPEPAPHLAQYIADTACNQRTSAASVDQLPVPDTTSGSRSKPSQQRAAEVMLQNYGRVPKPTTSLPNISGIDLDVFGFGDPSLSANDASKETEQQPSTHVRAAKSHHNLLQTEESPFLSQSLFSINSRCEPMPDVADLLTPIECRSYESDMGKSTGTIMLVSHTYAPLTTLSGEQKLGHNSEASPIHNTGSSRGVHYLAPSPIAHKQASMSQIGIRESNRNSMFIAGALLPAINMDEDMELHRQCQQQQLSRCQDSLGSRLNKREHRTSRYLYDVPRSSSSGGLQGTLSKAFSWSQRIGQGSPKRLNRASSLAVDQHKIYDIYEESLWHNIAHAPHAVPESTSTMSFSFDTSNSSAQLCDLPEKVQHQTSSTVDCASGSRLKSLHAMASSGAPWRMLRSIKLGASSRDKSTEWDCSSTYTGSECSDDTTGSKLAPPDMKRQASQPMLSNLVRKPSGLHMFVKRAGLGLVRRSVSFCKIVSGTGLAGGNDADCEGTRDSYDCNSSTLSSSSASIASSKRDKTPRRVLDAMRHVKNKLVKSLKPVGTHKESSTGIDENGDDDDYDVVSAYPTDSATGTDLDEYLSLSAIHSPEARSSANLDGSSCEAHIASASDASSGSGGNIAPKYAPPKCPSYLGLHRRIVANCERSNGDVQPVSGQTPVASNPFRQPPPPEAISAPAARLRPTQFKTPFTTLPYGAYAQLHQVQVQRR
ncbi:hypothetical protein GGI20_000719 [Coemansia sp. BCRC 34301]|nr:hypothetical protein GGI20_000719 [Coemansia sp. BCRC 34301]